MAESSYPAPGVTELQHERLLGRAMPSGLLGVPTDPVLAYCDGTGTREVRIRAARQAVVEGYGWQNDAVEVTKTLAANTSGSTRVDLIVLRLDRAAWTVRVQVVQGTPGAGTPFPTYNTGSTGVWELPVAAVTVANNASTLAASTVTALAWYIGTDGQILCTSATRPPHELGRRIWETDTTKAQLSDGTAWQTVYEDTGWVTITGESGWTGASTYIRVRRKNGQVFCRFDVHRSGGTVAAGTASTAFDIPDEYKTTSSFWVPCDLLGGGTGAAYFNATNGNVQIRNDDPMAAGVIARAAISYPAP